MMEEQEQKRRQEEEERNEVVEGLGADQMNKKTWRCLSGCWMKK